MRSLIIGGGFAGTAAAIALRDRGHDVQLLDDRFSLGGRARSDALGEMTIDTGAQLISSAFTRTMALLGGRDGRLPPSIIETAGRDALVRSGTRHPIQFGSMRSLLTFGGLGAMEKLRLGRHLLPALALHRDELEASASSLPRTLDSESSRAFVQRRIGARAAGVLVEPPLSFYAMSGDEVSLAFFLTLARYGSDSDVLAPSAGWSRALEGRLGGVTVNLGVRVSFIGMTGREVTVRTTAGDVWQADSVVIATGPSAAAELIAPFIGDHELTAWLRSVRTRPTWTLAMSVSAELERDAFGVFADPDESSMVAACAVHGAKLGVHAPSGRDVVLAWPTPAAAESLATASAEVIVAAMMPEVEGLLPALAGRVTQARVYRHDGGSPVPFPGFAADRARGRALASSVSLPIALAGDYLTTPLIEGAVISGEWAADHLVRLLGAK